MKRALITACFMASVGLGIAASGCEVRDVSSVIKGGKQLWELQKEAQQKAIREGVPARELDAIMEEAVAWIEEAAPQDRRVQASSYKKILVVGGTVNNFSAEDDALRSITDEEVAIRTKRMFTTLRNRPAMSASFKFFDRTNEHGVDLSAYTGDTSKYGSPLGGEGAPAPSEYHPEDIYYLTFAFEEIQRLKTTPAYIDFALTVNIEWGGNPGEMQHANIFERKLVFDKKKKEWVPQAQQ